MWRLYNHWVAKNIRSCPKWNKRCLNFTNLLEMVEHVFASNLQIILCKPMSSTNIIIFLFIPFSFLNSKNFLLAFARSVGPTSDHRQQWLSVGLQVHVNACYTKKQSIVQIWLYCYGSRSLFLYFDNFSCTLTTVYLLQTYMHTHHWELGSLLRLNRLSRTPRKRSRSSSALLSRSHTCQRELWWLSRHLLQIGFRRKVESWRSRARGKRSLDTRGKRRRSTVRSLKLLLVLQTRTCKHLEAGVNTTSKRWEGSLCYCSPVIVDVNTL